MSVLKAAQALAQAQGFIGCCSAGTGALLRVLAASKPGGTFAEFGTGCGVGSAYLLEGMDEDAQLFTAELAARRAELARHTLLDSRIRVFTGDWTSILSHGPFDLIFADAAPAKQPDELPRLVTALSSGGLLVMDNFSGPDALTARLNGHDPLREWLHGCLDLATAELRVGDDEYVLLGARMRP